MLKGIVTTAAFVSAALWSGTATASSLTVNYGLPGNPLGPTGTAEVVDIQSNGYTGLAYAGQFHLTADGGVGDFLAFCVDLFQFLEDGHSYVADSSFLSGAVISNIDRLYTSGYENVVDDVSEAGFQVALWEIVSDTGSIFDLNDGNFLTVAGANGEYNQAVEDSANAFLAGLDGAGTGKYKLTFLQSDTSQDLVTVSIMPLPSAVLMLLAGLGGLAGLRRFKGA